MEGVCTPTGMRYLGSGTAAGGYSSRHQVAVGLSGPVFLVPPELDEEKKPEEGKEDEDERVALTDVEHSHLLVVAVGSLERCRAAA